MYLYVLVFTVLYLTKCVMYRLTPYNLLVLFALISTLLSLES